jgi:excinuclease UvrABC nuclease subunit
MTLTTRHSGWVLTTSVEAAVRRAPNSPGVYAIGRVERKAGLPVLTEWVYVGRSTKGLRRRLAEHRPIAERNPGLRVWLMGRDPETEVWFTTTSSEADAVSLEAELIRDLNPSLNSVGTTRSVEKEVIA